MNKPAAKASLGLLDSSLLILFVIFWIEFARKKLYSRGIFEMEGNVHEHLYFRFCWIMLGVCLLVQAIGLIRRWGWVFRLRWGLMCGVAIGAVSTFCPLHLPAGHAAIRSTTEVVRGPAWISPRYYEYFEVQPWTEYRFRVAEGSLRIVVFSTDADIIEAHLSPARYVGTVTYEELAQKIGDLKDPSLRESTLRSWLAKRGVSIFSYELFPE